jgi:hypothetical protein
MKYLFKVRHACRRGVPIVALIAAFSLVLSGWNARASLNAYDAAVNVDAAAGLTPVATLTNPVTLTGANRGAFNFGNNSGDVTMEFVLEGNPSAGSGSAYLAVGANATSNLRYEQYNNTGQLGFTQLGVLDYLFAPATPSPVEPTHIAYVWNASTLTMTLYLNGSIAGTRSGVTPGFAMPSGAGWLGGNPGGGELMTGVIYRVTVYDEIVPEDTLQRHADAFNDVVRLPIIVSFSAEPPVVFTPGSSILTWNVQRADGLFINGADVTAAANLSVAPTTNTTYTLTASNVAGVVTRSVTLLVNPAPIVHSFHADRTFVGPGEPVQLHWNVSHGQTFSIAPAPGDVAAQTINGTGSVTVLPQVNTAYTLSAGNAFGTSTAALHIQIVQPASHLVISEFMADDDSVLADEDGDFSGWIELHNPTAGAVNLAGHFLTDDPAEPTRWAFPNRVLPAGGYLVVFASGKDRTNGPSLHANFGLSNDGEYLALVGPGPLLLHAFAPAFPPQREDISYGILGGDVSIERFIGLPTPGAANSEISAPPAPVQFSRASGFFTNNFTVTLASSEPGATVRYTLDGSDPANGVEYTTALTITNTTRIRAVSVVSNRLSRVSSESYVKLAAALAAYTSSLPILVIDNFGAGTIPQKGWSGTGAGIKQVPRQAAVWATFERQNGASALSHAPQMISDIAIRGRGAFSSTWRQKPYSVEAVTPDGAERKVAPLGMPEHADWVLYFPDPDDNKDPSLFFNTFAYELSRLTGRYSVRFRWVEAFVNEDGGELTLEDRRGVYAIIEKVSRGVDRLNFQPLSSDGATGSWLLNINRMDSEPEEGWPAENGATQPWFFHTAGPNRILQTPPNASVVGDDEPQQSNGYLNFDNPSGYRINVQQRAAIENWFDEFEDVLWNNAVWRDPVNGYRKYLDPVDFADYFVLNTLTRNGDGLLISMFPWKGDDGKLRMGPAWDYNWSAYYVSGGPTGTLLHRPDRLWYRRLFADPDFLQLYIDRWWDMRRAAMSDAGMEAIIDAQMNDITPEKALLNGLPSTSEWTNRLSQMKTWLKDRANWIDSNYLRPPVFNVNGGQVPDGFQVAIHGMNGTVYFTMDGSDPRAPGGAVASVAQAYQIPFPLFASTTVQARVRNGTNWSGLTKAVFTTPQDLTALALTEIMYNPPSFGSWAGDDLEFIEFKNVGAISLNLGTLFFDEGIDFTFTNGTHLAPGAFLVLARNAAAFQARYPGLTLHGTFSGRLDNNGETLRLATAAGNTVLALIYDDRAPWPLAADGHGFSAVPRPASLPTNIDDGSRWRGSAHPGGSPGTDDPAPSIGGIVINEILTHTDLPDVDAVELFNSTGSAVDIGGWFLSDDGSVPGKFRIPDGTIVPAGGYVVFTENDFNATPPTLFNFSLNSSGDSLYLSSGNAATNLTGYSHGVSFGAAASGVSFGRYVNSVGEEQFPAQLAVTLGASDAGPIVGPVVLSEIHYHPDFEGIEYVELRNLTAGTVALFDAAHPTNTWRVNGLGFTFPESVVLPANGMALIVATDPATFRARYSVPPEVLVFGPFSGGLQDSGERLELQRPEVPDADGVAYITIDEVRYNDKAPWPPGADGGGPSLQRRTVGEYGNDPVNWQAALPTPGGDFVPGDEPVIITSPESRIVVAYHDLTLSAAASGAAPLFYQWLFNNGPLAGATNATIVLTNIQPSQAGTYRIVVYNATGSATSAGAEVTVLLPAIIQQHPQSIATNAGRTVAFAVAALGTGPLRYQWLFNGTPLLHATNSSLSLTNIQAANDGFYSVIVFDNVGDITSAAARLAVLFEPFIIQHPVSQSLPTGGTATISVLVTNNATLPIGYRIRRNGVSLPETFVSRNEHSAFFLITNIRAPLTNFSIIVTNAARPNGISSMPALMTLLPDSDGDGLPDAWESQYGFNTNSAADALVDSDGDGMLNRDEWIAGTDPGDASSHLRFESIFSNLAGATMTFGAAGARTYTVEFTDGLGGGAWSVLSNVVARATNSVGAVADSQSATNRFYRLLTPARP